MEQETDYYRIASDFYLCKELPEDYLDMDKDSFDTFLEENAWEPFEHWTAKDINEQIVCLSDTMETIARKSANEAIQKQLNKNN